MPRWGFCEAEAVVRVDRAGVPEEGEEAPEEGAEPPPLRPIAEA